MEMPTDQELYADQERVPTAIMDHCDGHGAADWCSACDGDEPHPRVFLWDFPDNKEEYEAMSEREAHGFQDREAFDRLMKDYNAVNPVTYVEESDDGGSESGLITEDSDAERTSTSGSEGGSVPETDEDDST